MRSSFGAILTRNFCLPIFEDTIEAPILSLNRPRPPMITSLELLSQKLRKTAKSEAFSSYRVSVFTLTGLS